MSSLTHIEKQKLERELGMESGYVLAFSNRTFEEFFREVVGVQIYDSRFDLGSGLKTICLFCKGKSFTHINFSMSGLVLPAIQTYAENIQALRRVSHNNLLSLSVQARCVLI